MHVIINVGCDSMKQNTISFLELEKNISINKTINIDKSMKFDFVKTLTYIESPEGSSVLYFPIYLNVDDDLGGWYPINSDTREKLQKIILEKYEATVAEEDVVVEE